METNYNFYDIYKALEEIRMSESDTITEKACNNLKDALNKFMPDFRCRGVIVTQNFDKNFFGIFVLPYIFSQNNIDNWFAGHGINEYDREYTESKATSYYLEIDGKLLRDYSLSLAELWAIIFGEISPLNSPTPYNIFKNRMDAYIAVNNIHIDIKKIKDFNHVFYLMASLMLHNITSIFTTYYFENAFTPFIIDSYGMKYSYETAVEKLALRRSVENLVDHTNIPMTWYFKNYEDLYSNRYIDSMLRGSIKTEASSLVRNLSFKALDMLVKVDDELSSFIKSSVNEATKRKGLLYQLKHNGLKSIEDDLFEYNMRLRNVETQDDAILLMRQINSRMSILEEYLRDNPDDEEKERWTKVYKDYLALREALSKKTVYNRKMYGLFVDYNALQTMSQTGQLNTYY